MTSSCEQKGTDGNKSSGINGWNIPLLDVNV